MKTLLLILLISCTPAAILAGPDAKAAGDLSRPGTLEKLVQAGTKAIPTLKAALSGKRPDLAVLALGRIGGPEAVPALTIAAGHDDGEVRATTAWALGRCGGGVAASFAGSAPAQGPATLVLCRLAGDQYAPARAAAVNALALAPTAEADAALRRAVADRNQAVRMAAVNAIRSGKRKDLFNALIPRLDYRRRTRQHSAAATAPPAQKPAMPVIWAEPGIRVRLAIIRALGELAVPDAVPALIYAMERENSFNRLAIMKAIEGMGKEAAPVCLGRIVPTPYDQQAVQKHLPLLINNGTLAVIAGRLGDARCIPHLIDTLKLPRQEIGRNLDLTELYTQTVKLLGTYRVETAGADLASLLKTARVQKLSVAVQDALRAVGRPAARPLARNLDDWQTAPLVMKMLREPGLRTQLAREPLLKYLTHQSDEVRLAAVETLGMYLANGILNEYDVPALEAMKLDPNREVRGACARWLAAIAKKSGNEVAP